MALCTCSSSFRKQAQIALRKICAREEINGCTLCWPGNIEVHHATNSNFKESQFTNCCHQDNALHTIKLLDVEHLHGSSASPNRLQCTLHLHLFQLKFVQCTTPIQFNL